MHGQHAKPGLRREQSKARDSILFIAALVCSLTLVAAGVAKGLDSIQRQSPDPGQLISLGDVDRNSAGTAQLLPQDNTARVSVAPTNLLPPLLTAAEIASSDDGITPTVLPDVPYLVPDIPDATPTPEDEESPEDETGTGDDGGQGGGERIAVGDVWFVGDSIAVGFHEAIGGDPDYLTGYIGAGSSSVTADFLNEVASGSKGVRPILLVALGTNDSLGNEETFRGNINALMDSANAMGSCVAWLTIHRISDSASWDSYNKVLRQEQEKHERLRIVDWAALAANDPSLLWDDGIHVRPEGYKALWRLVTKAVSGCLT